VGQRAAARTRWATERYLIAVVGIGGIVVSPVYRRPTRPHRGRGRLLCGSGSFSSTTTTSGSSTTASAQASTTPAITIKGFAFTVTPAKTGTITIKNDDTTKHTVTADDGSFDVDVPAGGTATIDVPKAGSYPFHCKIHPSMKATLVVT
jgi:plastocyanin